MLSRLMQRFEAFCFGRRALVLSVLALFTVLMGVFALQLRMEAGFDKQLPQGHEYIRIFNHYRESLFGANRLTVVVHPRQGDIWNQRVLRQVSDVTEAVASLPGVQRASVTSLWTPNVFVTEITEEGFKAEPVTGGDLTPEDLSDSVIAKIRDRVMAGGHMGTLVARDHGGALISADLLEEDPRTREKLDYIAFNRLLEEKIRGRFETPEIEIQIIGFAKQIGDIAEGGKSVIRFFALAFLLTALAVWWYCRSIRLTLLPMACSLMSLVWQFGTLRLIGYGLDPLGILVPFLVFAIGVSHGVQQINFIVREISHGADTMVAARRSFTGLLIPGTLALITAFVSFITLALIPIPMIRELAITASIGVAYKIVTNLVMLPVAASYFNFSGSYAEREMLRRERRSGLLRGIARIAEPRNAAIATAIGIALLAIAWFQSQGRHVGSVQPGAPELHADARFNRDALAIGNKFDVGLDWITVVIEAPRESCNSYAVLHLLEDLGWTMANVPGVLSVESAATLTKVYFAGLNEGNPKLASIPRDPLTLGSTVSGISKQQGIKNQDCSVLALNLFLSDHKATTIKGVIGAVKQYRAENPLEGVTIQLASGNAGVQAATNEVLESSELPMMLYVYAAILALVFLAYRDWRAMIACCLPLTVATWIGYWFMKDLNISLTVATLPVMVLAVGIGVDYAFYIYNRLQLHLSHGLGITKALEFAILETGVATVFTALTLSVGVATWSFSELKFQADMGKLLTFMFMVNMAMAITLLPAFAVVLEKLVPRRGPVRVPGILQH